MNCSNCFLTLSPKEYNALQEIARYLGREIKDLVVTITWNKVTSLEIVDTARQPKPFKDLNLLSDLVYLKELILWGNEIEEIEGLEKMGGLEYLILSKNKIKKIKNLENCPLKYLDISDNPLESESKEEIIKLEKRGVYVRIF